MKTMIAAGKRSNLTREQTGQYTSDYPDDTPCVCGCPFGNHAAANPRFCHGPEAKGECPKGCEKFRKSRKKLTTPAPVAHEGGAQ